MSRRHGGHVFGGHVRVARLVLTGAWTLAELGVTHTPAAMRGVDGLLERVWRLLLRLVLVPLATWAAILGGDRGASRVARWGVTVLAAVLALGWRQMWPSGVAVLAAVWLLGLVLGLLGERDVRAARVAALGQAVAEQTRQARSRHANEALAHADPAPPVPGALGSWPAPEEGTP